MKRVATKEEVMKRFLASRNKKRAYLVKLEEDMRKEYKARMGVEAKDFFVLWYPLIIANLNNVKSPRDTKVRDSILAIVDEFFNKNQSTLLYICETGDGKQGIRSRLFEYWFETYRYKALFTMLTSSIVDEEWVVNFATLILRNDNPLLAEVVAEFSESVQLLSQKPE